MIGEAPGEQEEKRKVPFVGASGREVNHYLRTLAEVPRSHFYVTNMVKCRPPMNRTPYQAEIDICCDHLEEEVEIVQPKFILALGATACNYVFGSLYQLYLEHGMEQLTRWGIPGMGTYHPAAGLYEGGSRFMGWLQEDMIEFGRMVRGEKQDPVDEYLEPDYQEVT